MDKIRQLWSKFDHETKREYRNKFAKKFTGAYHDYYIMANVESLANDSLFIAFFAEQSKQIADFEIEKQEALNYGYRPIHNLTCEPPELEAARIKEISGMAK